MSALASMVWPRVAVWPRLLAAIALLALTLAGGHETQRPAEPAAAIQLAAPVPLGRVLRPAALADAREWPRGMVITPPATGDAIATADVPAPLPRGPLTTLLSGLFDLLGSRGA